MNTFFHFFGILGFAGMLIMMGYLLAPKVIRTVNKIALKKQRKRFEKKAFKQENYKEVEPYEFDDVWN